MEKPKQLIAKRMSLIKESPTLAISAKAKELQKQGKTPREATLAEMDALWEDAKKLEKDTIKRG